jgi:hypothetical protein
MVKGKEAPLKANWELLLLAEDTVTLAPTALIVMGSVSVVPTATLPKFRGVGPTTNWPVAVPVPVRGMVSPGPETNRLPPTAPADFGVNATFNVTLCPTAKVSGRVGALRENPLPTAVIDDRVTLQERSFLTTTGTVAVVPIATWPKDAAEGLAVRASLLTPVPPS